MACFDPRRRPSAREQLEILEEVEAEIEELEGLEELDEWEEMKARFSGMGVGLEWNEGLGFDRQVGLDDYALQAQYSRREQEYMTGVMGNYGWEGVGNAGVWSGGGYVFPTEEPRYHEVGSYRLC